MQVKICQIKIKCFAETKSTKLWKNIHNHSTTNKLYTVKTNNIQNETKIESKTNSC